MSMTIWLNVRIGNSYKSTEDDLSALFALQENLDSLAASLEVTPLTAFFDETDCRYNLDEEGEFEESDEGWPADAARWHDAADVLRTAAALHAHLDSNPEAIPVTESWTQAQVLDDLRILIPGLEKAAAGKRHVHLLVLM